MLLGSASERTLTTCDGTMSNRQGEATSRHSKGGEAGDGCEDSHGCVGGVETDVVGVDLKAPAGRIG